MAFEVWKESRINFPRWNNTQRDFIEVYWKLREEASDIDWNVFATLAWSIWNNRNLFKYKGTCKAANTIVRDARRYVEQFRQGTTSSNQTLGLRPDVRAQWHPLDYGWYKINVNELCLRMLVVVVLA